MLQNNTWIDTGKPNIHLEFVVTELNCRQSLYAVNGKSFEFFVSHFEQSWGIDALIGLDFFRRFLVTIDYKNGFLVTSPY